MLSLLEVSSGIVGRVDNMRLVVIISEMKFFGVISNAFSVTKSQRLRCAHFWYRRCQECDCYVANSGTMGPEVILRMGFGGVYTQVTRLACGESGVRYTERLVLRGVSSRLRP